tara:strand:+ start:767 stop:1021 length:255 start_codon:yes stop_codon:yes gene_type:complete
MDNFKSRRNKKDFYEAIEGLIVNNKSMFFSVLYKAIMEHPSYVVLSDMPMDRKCEILEDMLKHYEVHEDYEKCAKLVKMKNNLT